MSHAFLVLQDIMAEGWILKIAQDWSAFAVSEVNEEVAFFFFQALPEMLHIWAGAVNECQQVSLRTVIPFAMLLLSVPREAFSPAKQVPICVIRNLMGKWFTLRGRGQQTFLNLINVLFLTRIWKHDNDFFLFLIMLNDAYWPNNICKVWLEFLKCFFLFHEAGTFSLYWLLFSLALLCTSHTTLASCFIFLHHKFPICKTNSKVLTLQESSWFSSLMCVKQ